VKKEDRTDATEVPRDILQRVAEDFADPTESSEVLDFISNRHVDTRALNVGASQFCRAILVLADGDLTELKRLASLPKDPRDIIHDGEAKLGHPKHYFVLPFGDQ